MLILNYLGERWLIQVGYIFPNWTFNPILFKLVFLLNYVLDNFKIDIRFNNLLPKKEQFLVALLSVKREGMWEWSVVDFVVAAVVVVFF